MARASMFPNCAPSTPSAWRSMPGGKPGPLQPQGALKLVRGGQFIHAPGFQPRGAAVHTPAGVSVSPEPAPSISDKSMLGVLS